MKLLKTTSHVASNVVVESGEVLISAARSINKAVSYIENELDHALLTQKIEHEKELEALKAANPSFTGWTKS